MARRMMEMAGIVLLGLALTLSASARAQTGVDERPVSAPVATADASRIEVVEVFGYWCIHCARLDPQFKAWRDAQSADVQVRLLPAVFSDAEEVFASAYYAADAMGVLPKLHGALFEATAVQHKVRDRAGILDVVKQQGVDVELFASTMDSFAIKAKVGQSKALTRRFGIGVTPTLVIEGKTLLEPASGGFDALLARADALIAEARAARNP